MLHTTLPETSTRFASTGPAVGSSARNTGSVLNEALSKLGSVVGFDRNAEVFADEEPADYVYQVVSGTVRTCKFLEDGRRQVGAFHYPGDLFGLEPFGTYSVSAETVTPCQVRVVKRASLTAVAAHDAALANALWMVATRELQRVNEHMVLLGRKCATERLLDFLNNTASRLNTPDLVDIPMSRQDIADHIGLTIETVSRTMTRLQETGSIALDGSRRIHVIDHPAAA